MDKLEKLHTELLFLKKPFKNGYFENAIDKWSKRSLDNKHLVKKNNQQLKRKETEFLALVLLYLGSIFLQT